MASFNEEDLVLAQKKGLITFEETIALLNYFSSKEYRDLKSGNPQTQNKPETAPKNQPIEPADQSPTKNKFTLENFLYYFGAIIIILTMAWYAGKIWADVGFGALFVTCSAYCIFFVFIANFLWKKELKTPAGLLYVACVATVPLLVFAFQHMVGIFPSSDKMYSEYSNFHIFIRGGWIAMEIATILAGLVVLKYRQVPFVTLPIAWSAWYLSMDIVPLLFGAFREPTWDERKFVSLIFGLGLIIIAFLQDKKGKKDFSHWYYIFGVIIFWSSLSSYLFENEFALFVFALLNIGFMLTSILLQRKVFMVFGAIGFIGYLGHLAYNVFKDSAIFPIVLVAIGLLIIFFGIYYKKNAKIIQEKLLQSLPESIKAHLPK